MILLASASNIIARKTRLDKIQSYSTHRSPEDFSNAATKPSHPTK